MITSLKISNLAIVKDVEVSFSDGLNVITGETGAGKSIIMGALALVLGERADKNAIRSGENKCSIEALFSLSDTSRIDVMLEEQGIEPCENGTLILKRVISNKDSGRNFINNCSTTVQTLKNVGDILVDMHGPHDHQSLLNPESQLDILDSFAHSVKTRTSYETLFQELSDLKKQREALNVNDAEVPALIDMLSFQVKEIEDADLSETDEQELDEAFTVSANSQRILELAGQVQNTLTEDDSSAYNSLIAVRNSLSELERILKQASKWREEAESIITRIQELSASVTDYASGIEADSNRARELEQRVSLVSQLKRKYGGSIPAVLDFLEKSKKRLHDLQTRGEAIEKIEALIKEKNNETISEGRKLTKIRKKAAISLSEAIVTELHDLGFKHGVFGIKLSEAEPHASGMDNIEFEFAPNAGEPVRNLRTIASSGEISRVMLAVKTVLADHDQIPVLVFDEIDANVGGEMGKAIGSKLKKVSAQHQVLCITHLPQVASHGKTHLVVEKQVSKDRTFVQIMGVSADNRVGEIARMLGGAEKSGTALKHAKEMLETGNRK